MPSRCEAADVDRVEGQKAADARTQQEADAERRAHPAEVAGALLGRRDVGDIGVGGGEAGGRRAVQHPAQQQPAERRREGHHQEVERQAEDRDQHHRPAAITIGEHAEHRAGDELHDAPGDAEDELPVGGRRGRGRAGCPEERADQARQHRDHQPERQRVHHRRGEDEAERRLAAARARRRRRLARRLVRRRVHALLPMRTLYDARSACHHSPWRVRKTWFGKP